jgi:ElaB/YqjD/DUF883 family membrane-anchored ribosome-binding protein
MAASTKTQNSRRQLEQSTEDTTQQAKEMSQDVIQYLTDYARERPGTAALWCLGVGFVLGWKLKPW